MTDMKNVFSPQRKKVSIDIVKNK
jgi:hypothetical protein